MSPNPRLLDIMNRVLTTRYKRLSDWLYFFGVLPALAAFPRRIGYGLAIKQGRHFFNVNEELGSEVTRNISLVLDDRHWSAFRKTEAARRVFETQAARDLDTFYLPFWKPGNIRFNCRIEGVRLLDQARKEKRGVLLFTGNFGSPGCAVAALSLKGYKLHHFITAYDEQIPPGSAFLAFEKLRKKWMTKCGAQVYQLALENPTSANASIADVCRLLGQGEIVSMTLDVPPGGVKNRATVNFLGRNCLFAASLISLAHVSKSPVLPFFSVRDKAKIWRQRVILQKPVPMTGEPHVDLQSCADQLGDIILQHPDQWLGWETLPGFWHDGDQANHRVAS